MMLRLLTAAALLSGCCANPRPPLSPPAPTPTAARAEIRGQDRGIDWSARPPAGPEPLYQLPTPTTLTLGNGLRVVVIENRRLALVSMLLINPVAGSAHDPSGASGLAALTADLLDESAGKWSSLELADELERLGVDLDVSAATDAAVVAVDTLTSTLEPTLALISAIVSQPRFTSADFTRVKGERISSIKRRRDRPRTIASLIFDRVLFGSHAYGLPNSGLEDTLAAITHAQVTDFYSHHYSASAMTLVIAGDVTAAALAPMLERTLGSWPARKLTPEPTNLKLPQSQPPRLFVHDRPDSAQSVVWIGRVTMPRRDPRYARAMVINTVLGGGFTSRLNNRLREQLGYTYGASSSFWFARHSGSWAFSSSIKTASTIAGIDEALTLIEQLRREDVPAVELANNQHRIVRKLPQEFATNAGIATTFADLVIDDLPLDFYGDFPANISAVSAAQAREYAVGNFAREDLIMVVVGDLTHVLDGLLGLGFGDAVEVDHEGRPVRSHRAH